MLMRGRICGMLMFFFMAILTWLNGRSMAKGNAKDIDAKLRCQIPKDKLKDYCKGFGQGFYIMAGFMVAGGVLFFFEQIWAAVITLAAGIAAGAMKLSSVQKQYERK